MKTEKRNGGRRLDGYVRVSDVHGREGDSFISPDQQREKITAWATIHNHEVVFQEPELDVSGGKLKRPVLDLIMDRIRSGETDGIAIARLDRFSRAGVGDALALIEEIKTVGGIFGCVEPQIDTSDPVMGEFILTIFLALARMERQRIRVNWADSKARAVGRGIHISANVPFGYIRPREEKNQRTGKEPTLPLMPDPETGWMVAELYRMRAAGESWEQLRQWLVANNAPTVRGAEWAASTLMGVINNRVYLGEARGAGRRPRHQGRPYGSRRRGDLGGGAGTAWPEVCAGRRQRGVAARPGPVRHLPVRDADEGRRRLAAAGSTTCATAVSGARTRRCSPVAASTGYRASTTLSSTSSANGRGIGPNGSCSRGSTLSSTSRRSTGSSLRWSRPVNETGSTTGCRLRSAARSGSGISPT